MNTWASPLRSAPQARRPCSVQRPRRQPSVAHAPPCSAAQPSTNTSTSTSTATGTSTSTSTTTGTAAAAAAAAARTPAPDSRASSAGRDSSAAPPRPPPAAPTTLPVIGASGVFLTTTSSLDLARSSLDGDALASGELLESEFVQPYILSEKQEEIIHKLEEAMDSCSTAFVAVALTGIALSLAAHSGMEMEDAPEVLFNGVTVGDVASWVDSLLVAGLLRYGAASFEKVLDTRHKEKQLAYTFQGINRLGLMFEQFAIAAGTVSIVTTLEAAAKWPPLVTVASGLFFGQAVLRSGAMWLVLSRYGNTLDDVELALETQRRCMDAAADEGMPLLDRLAIRIAFNYLQMFSAAGRRAASGIGGGAAAVSGGAAGAGGALASRLLTEEMRMRLVSTQRMLRSIPLPIIRSDSDSLDGEDVPAEGGGGASGEGAAFLRMGAAYELTQEEERLIQATQSSLNSAGLALVLQSFATGLLVTANLAAGNYSGAVGDIIQTVNKAVAAELIFVGTANFDRALYTEGCDVDHLLEGLGRKGITKLFQNLSLLAWAVVLAKGLALVAPWEESSPLMTYVNENLGHMAGEVVLEGQEVLVNMLP